MTTLHETNFTNLPGQTGEVYRGKVGDTYTLEHNGQELIAVVRTDRISAFDVVLPQTIPYKGQVLNQMSADLLTSVTSKGIDQFPHWLLEAPDPNASVGYAAKPFKLEMIMRAYLLGSAYKAYNEEGVREFAGNRLPDGMQEFDRFGSEILTPTTKAEVGHDENISPSEIVAQGLATELELKQMITMSHALFIRGVSMAAQRGLILADTKYEFGKLPDGRIAVIDEVHTPDSSRYFPTAEFLAYKQRAIDRRPEQMSKEFVREWLKAHGFAGQSNETPPVMSDEFRNEVSGRYMGLYEKMTGQKFQPAKAESEEEVQARIEQNITTSVLRLAA